MQQRSYRCISRTRSAFPFIPLTRFLPGKRAFYIVMPLFDGRIEISSRCDWRRYISHKINIISCISMMLPQQEARRRRPGRLPLGSVGCSASSLHSSAAAGAEGSTLIGLSHALKPFLARGALKRSCAGDALAAFAACAAHAYRRRQRAPSRAQPATQVRRHGQQFRRSPPVSRVSVSAADFTLAMIADDNDVASRQLPGRACWLGRAALANERAPPPMPHAARSPRARADRAGLRCRRSA